MAFPKDVVKVGSTCRHRWLKVEWPAEPQCVDERVAGEHVPVGAPLIELSIQYALLRGDRFEVRRRNRFGPGDYLANTHGYHRYSGAVA